MATPEDELNNYLDELTATISTTNEALSAKGKEIIKTYKSIITHKEPATVPTTAPRTSLKSMVNRAQQFIGVKETVTQKINKEINIVLKDDKNIDINMGTYPELQLNEAVCNKIKEKPDPEKLNSYIYYFFYILMKYIIKPIIEDRTKKIINLKAILLKNNEVLKNYINYDFNVTSQNYSTTKQQFTDIHTFITEFLKNGPEILSLEATKKTTDIKFNELLAKLQQFQFT